MQPVIIRFLLGSISKSFNQKSPCHSPTFTLPISEKPERLFYLIVLRGGLSQTGPKTILKSKGGNWKEHLFHHLSFLNLCAALCFVAQSCLTLYNTVWTVAPQAPPSVGFSRQEYCSELPCPSPEDLPDPGIKPPSLLSLALAGGSFITSAT